MAGCLLGEIFGTTFSDRFGRKKVHVGASVTMAVVGTAVAWMPTYAGFVALRIVEGFLLVVNKHLYT